MSSVEDYYRTHLARVRAGNKAFERMTPAQRRVVIARDILRLAATPLFVPHAGTYGDGVLNNAVEPPTMPDYLACFDDGDVRKRVAAAEVTCRGCAVAAIAYASLLRRGYIGRFYDTTMTPPDWQDVPHQWEEIEHAFERWKFPKTPGRSWDECDQAERLRSAWVCLPAPADERFRLIFEYIITQKGNFSYLKFLRSLQRRGIISVNG